MRFLIVGAGALGGYFGGRLLETGQDVTFLVRPHRAETLARTGLVINSPCGNWTCSSPPVLLSREIKNPFDVIIVACKAYALEACMESFAAAVGSETLILPVLNGMQHIEKLCTRFGREHILGGLCEISATLGTRGEIMHLSQGHKLTFGELDDSLSTRAKQIADQLEKANFTTILSPNIRQEMWEKWVFIASLAGITCLMRATIGDILKAGGAAQIDAIITECLQIATAQGFAPRPPVMDRYRASLTAENSTLAASMLRDLEQGSPTEADHVIGNLLKEAKGKLPSTAMLQTAYVHLKASEARKARTA